MDGHEGLSSNPSTHIKKKIKQQREGKRGVERKVILMCFYRLQGDREATASL